jgi:hypothetical protein
MLRAFILAGVAAGLLAVLMVVGAEAQAPRFRCQERVGGNWITRWDKAGGGPCPVVATTPPPTPTLVPPAPTVPPTATLTPSPTVAPTASPTSVPGGYFATLPPGSVLPSGAECAARVRRSAFEPRPQLYTQNNYVPPFVAIKPPEATGAHATAWATRIDGNFTGTTDEIIQWASCKWGIDEDLTRARAVRESTWCRTLPCIGDIGLAQGQAYGILQITAAAWFAGSYPRSEQSTAWNLDYALAYQRACFEGDMTWLGTGYAAGIIDICVRSWFHGGNWRDAASTAYLNDVLDYKARKVWLLPGF